MTRMQPCELDAWLGDARDQMTDEQVETFARIVRDIEDRWPDPDDVEEATAAMSGALMLILGDDTLAGVGARFGEAYRARRRAAAQLTGAVLASEALGATEAEIVREARINRVTARRMLGK